MLHRNLSSLCILSSLLSLLFACKETRPIASDLVSTDSLSLQLDALQDGNAMTSVEATVHVGPWTSTVFSTLSTGDKLLLRTSDGLSVEMGKVNGKTAKYESKIPLASGKIFVDFIRQQGANALSNTVEIPPVFSLLAPSGKVSRAKSFSVTWSAEGTATSELELKSPCMDADSVTMHPVSNTREISIQATDLKILPDKQDEDCTVTITLTRSIEQNTGFAPDWGQPCFSSGKQVRTVTVETTP